MIYHSKEKINVMHLQCAVGEGGGPDKTILKSSEVIDKENFRMITVYIRKKKDPNFKIGDRAIFSAEHATRNT